MLHDGLILMQIMTVKPTLYATSREDGISDFVYWFNNDTYTATLVTRRSLGMLRDWSGGCNRG